MGTAIGDTYETSGSAFVYYDRVLRTALKGQQDVARLLAYVMAHEMGHLLLPSPAHASSGIMRPEWDGDDLHHIASGSLQFTAAQANAHSRQGLRLLRGDGGQNKRRLAVTETVTVRVRREPLLLMRATPNLGFLRRVRAEGQQINAHPSERKAGVVQGVRSASGATCRTSEQWATHAPPR